MIQFIDQNMWVSLKLLVTLNYGCFPFFSLRNLKFLHLCGFPVKSMFWNMLISAFAYLSLMPLNLCSFDMADSDEYCFKQCCNNLHAIVGFVLRGCVVFPMILVLEPNHFTFPICWKKHCVPVVRDVHCLD